MRVRFWGVRGNIATPGAEFARHGGNTSCVEVIGAGNERLILDAGTGIIPAGRALMAETPLGKGAGEVMLVLSHCHIDHIQGFPFFGPIYVRGNVIRVRAVAREGKSTFDVLEEELNPNYSPLYSLTALHGTFDIQDWDGTAPFSWGGLAVRGFELPHGRHTSTALVVSEGSRAVAYLSDVEYPDEEALQRAAASARGSTMLIHDSMHLPADVPARRGYGHSSYEDSVRVAHAAGVSRLVLFHHDPDREDAAVDQITVEARELCARLGADLEVVAAVEGATLEV